MEMPKISTCDVSECAYNKDNCCHALAITIGDPAGPKCDTFCASTVKGGDMMATGSVGACKCSRCNYNMDLECQASSISVGYRQNEVDCLTFMQS